MDVEGVKIVEVGEMNGDGGGWRLLPSTRGGGTGGFGLQPSIYITLGIWDFAGKWGGGVKVENSTILT